MALTNPNHNLTNADVTRLNNGADILVRLIAAWSPDGRYSGYVPELQQCEQFLRVMAQTVDDYLDVQGT